jgi:hypothetical protein
MIEEVREHSDDIESCGLIILIQSIVGDIGMLHGST